MYRMILIVVFALVVGSGAIVAAAQGGGQTEAPEAGATAGCATPGAALPEIAEATPGAVDPCATPEIGTPVDCGTPVDTLRVSPAASPELEEIEEIVETATPELDEAVDIIATAVVSPGASPVAVDPCGGAQPSVE